MKQSVLLGICFTVILGLSVWVSIETWSNYKLRKELKFQQKFIEAVFDQLAHDPNATIRSVEGMEFLEHWQ